MVDPSLFDYRTDPPSRPDWNSIDVTKSARAGHTRHDVEALDPRRCETWRNLHGPFWGDIKLTTLSGVQIKYGEPNGGSREPAGLRRQGVGIKWRGQGDSWNGLPNEQPQFHGMELFTSQFGILREPTETFKLPVMGMPPREPEGDTIARIRRGDPFNVTDWFRGATVGKASTYFHEDCLNIGKGTVTITISPAYEFEVAEAEQDHKKPSKDSYRNYHNLYFIQLMPNELPSFVIYLNRKEQKLIDARINSGVYRSFSSTSNSPGCSLRIEQNTGLADGQEYIFDQVSRRRSIQSLEREDRFQYRRWPSPARIARRVTEKEL